MLFGLDGVEIGLIIVFLCLFGGIMSGFPVAFAIGGAAVISFGIIASLDSSGLLIHQAIDTGSDAYKGLLADGIARDTISVFRHPDLPRIEEALFDRGWEHALNTNLSFIVNRMNERVIAGQSIETLLAVLMFVMMGITLERSKIANDLLTTMARVFGPLPGGLAVSVVVVGAFLAASTGIVGATVVTMGLLSLPTMLRNNYSPELATGVIAASGTLGQIIPPSIVIVLLGTLAGDLYSTAQEARAQSVGCSDALTYLGEAAVVSVGTLFQAAILPGVLLAVLYAAYAFGYAALNPHKAPPVVGERTGDEIITRGTALSWFLVIPGAMIGAVLLAMNLGLVGSQDITVDSYSDVGQTASLRTNVSEQCAGAMIELHGQEKWDAALAQQSAIDSAGGVQESHALSEDEIAVALEEKIATRAPIGTGVVTLFLLLGLVIAVARGIAPSKDIRPLAIGGIGVIMALIVDMFLITPTSSSGVTFVLLAIPMGLTLYGCRAAAVRLGQNDLVRVVFPPLVLIIAVLGSILGGIKNRTPAAALGAWGAIVLAAYHLAIFGILYSCWVLFKDKVLSPVVRETAKVTSMVFTILIGSQLLNLVVISFGGEHYIQAFLKSFDSEMKVFLIVMLVLFIMGFVLDFLEIIYIVIPIVGPVIYGGTMDPKWVTIMIAVNLQTSFLTPPFGFALFYLRGVAPKSVTTGHIYRGVIPFVLIQVAGLALLWTFPSVVTIIPNLLPN